MHDQPSHAGLASLVQSRGRGDDSMLVHMTPQEVGGLQALAMASGGSLSINPHTGLPEAGFLKSILPTLLGAVLAPFTGGLSAAMLVGAGTGLVEKDWKKGLLAGLGAFGGAGIGQALSSAGTTAATSAASNAAKVGLDTASKATTLADLGITAPSTFGTTSQLANIAAPSVQEGVKQFGNIGLKNMFTDAGSQAFKTMGTGIQNIAASPGTVGKQFLSDVGYMKGAAAAAPMMFDQPDFKLPEGQKPQYYVGSEYETELNPERGQAGQPYWLSQRYTPGHWSSTYPGMAEGGAIPQPNPAYPQSNITKSSYAPALGYNKPSELLDGYEAKINPFTGEEKFADGGSTDDKDTMRKAQPMPVVQPPPPAAQTPEQFYRSLMTPRAPAQSNVALQDYIANLNKSLIPKPKAAPTPPTKPTPPTGGGGTGTGTGTGAGTGTPAVDPSVLGFDGTFNLPPGFSLNTAVGRGTGTQTYDPTTQTYNTAGTGITTPTTTEPPPYMGGKAGILNALRQQEASSAPQSGGIGSMEYDPLTQSYKSRAAANQMYDMSPMEMQFADGGVASLGTYSDGGRLLRGPGDGVSDDIPAEIHGSKVQPARLADGEFVFPARIVSEIGNGSTEAGAKKLYSIMDKIQRDRGRTTKNVAANTRADRHFKELV